MGQSASFTITDSYSITIRMTVLSHELKRWCAEKVVKLKNTNPKII